MWVKTFRAGFCEHTGCAPEQFEQRLLRRGLHRRSLPLALLMRALRPDYFDLELRTLRYLGDSESTSEFRAELDTYRFEYRRKGGPLRRVLGVRLSGRRLMAILDQLGPELQGRRRTRKVASSRRTG